MHLEMKKINLLIALISASKAAETNKKGTLH